MTRAPIALRFDLTPASRIFSQWLPPVLTDAEWGGMAVPILFLAGEHETIYSAKKAVGRLRRVAPRVRAEIIPGAGHDLTFVQAEAVDRRILEFLGQQTVAAI